MASSQEGVLLQQGLVVRVHGGHYYVESGDETIDCLIRGRIKQEMAESDLVAIGDRVRWHPTEEGYGIIESVLPRESVLSRCPPASRTQKEQVIVANADQVVVVFSLVALRESCFAIPQSITMTSPY